jgi:hypothetical protein
MKIYGKEWWKIVHSNTVMLMVHGLFLEEIFFKNSHEKRSHPRKLRGAPPGIRLTAF